MLLRDRLYFTIKPLLPWSLRILLRRLIARRKMAVCRSLWPVDPSAGATPAGWTGWPDGKAFAVVLTHDIEGSRGLARCSDLADAEARLGFRSSFNFIPEGSYETPPQLRASLVARGFEVGVHDLRHDGSLYSGRKAFGRHARQINQYLKEWNAVGFRSGFMYHNQDWLHQLDVEYDASTFDTDPFEPQPDAANTIFPFWVPPSSDLPHASRGYVELPYTLPQDSTLYLVLQEKTDAIWRNKLDWIASRGGMALVNVHPDYLHFRSERSVGSPTVLDHYLSLLQYIKERYAGMYWHPLPRDMAAFVKGGKDCVTPAIAP